MLLLLEICVQRQDFIFLKEYSIMQNEDWQLRFTLVGFILPPLRPEIKVTDRLILRKPKEPNEQMVQIGNELVPATDALVLITTDGSQDKFKLAEEYLQKFLELFLLTNGHTVRIYRYGAAVNLAKHKFGEIDYGEMKGMKMLRAESEIKLWSDLDDLKWVFPRLFNTLQSEENAYLRLALSYYHRAVLSNKLEEILIDLMVCAEALFSKGDEYGKTIASRLSFMVRKDEKERDEINKELKELYRKRSAIVHGSYSNIDPQKVANLFRYLGQALREFLLLCRVKSREEINQLVDSGSIEEKENLLINIRNELYADSKPELIAEYIAPRIDEKHGLLPAWIKFCNKGMGKAVNIYAKVKTSKCNNSYGPHDKILKIVDDFWRIPLQSESPIRLEKEGDTIDVCVACEDALGRSYSYDFKLKTDSIPDDIWNKLIKMKRI